MGKLITPKELDAACEVLMKHCHEYKCPPEVQKAIGVVCGFIEMARHSEEVQDQFDAASRRTKLKKTKKGPTNEPNN